MLILELTNPQATDGQRVILLHLCTLQPRAANGCRSRHFERSDVLRLEEALRALGLGNGLPENDSFQRELKSPVQYERREEWKDQKFE